MNAIKARARTARLSRRLGLDPNPLRRASDWAETWIRLGLTIAFLAAGPLAAVAAGHWMNNAGLREAKAQAAAEYQVRATLLHADLASYDPAPARMLLQTRRPARWAAPAGPTRMGEVTTAPWARSGDTVTIWTNASGQLAPPPLRPSEITVRVVLFAALPPAVLAIALLGLLRLSRRLLDRRRLASWEAAWSAVGPHWTRHSR